MRRSWFGAGDLALIGRRRRDRNQLGFAIQLCALRYPGRLLRPGELIPDKALRFVAEQIGTEPEALIAYAARFQTRYEQVEVLRKTFGFARSIGRTAASFWAGSCPWIWQPPTPWQSPRH
jgi:TnpA family transposase